MNNFATQCRYVDNTYTCISFLPILRCLVLNFIFYFTSHELFTFNRRIVYFQCFKGTAVKGYGIQTVTKNCNAFLSVSAFRLVLFCFVSFCFVYGLVSRPEDGYKTLSIRGLSFLRVCFKGKDRPGNSGAEREG